MGKMHPLLYKLRLGCWPQGDPQVMAFNAASDTNEPAIETLVANLKSNSVWNRLTHIFPLIGTTATSQSINLRNPGTNNLVFAGGGLHGATGYNAQSTGGGSTDIPTTTESGTTSFSLGVTTYSRTQGAWKDVASANAGGSGIHCNFSGSTYCDILDVNTNRFTVFGGGKSHVISHGPANQVRMIINGTLAGSISVGTYQNVGFAPWFLGTVSTNVYSFLFYGLELSLSEMEFMHAQMVLFNDTMGRTAL
jgi:hypothetical protein